MSERISIFLSDTESGIEDGICGNGSLAGVLLVGTGSGMEVDGIDVAVTSTDGAFSMYVQTESLS